VGCSLEKKPSFKEEKLAFEHKNGEKEQPQPQLYGTSYLLVKITLLGLFSLNDGRLEAFQQECDRDEMQGLLLAQNFQRIKTVLEISRRGCLRYMKRVVVSL